MLKTLFLLMLLFPVARPAFAQKDEIEGCWTDEKGEAKIQIYKVTDGKFWGKIVWLKEPLRDGKPKLDDKNPKPAWRSRPVMGLALLSRFTKDDEDTYTDGEIYDPKSGKTYDCKMTLRKGNNELGIRGYVGISLIGRTTVWKRTAL